MKITVQKKNPANEVTYQYEGIVLERGEGFVKIEAFFDRKDMPFQDVIFKTGDRFIEYYYSDRWYNIFAIHDKDDGRIKGWYCNIGMPAKIEDGVVSYIDLALDLWVSVNWEQTILDEDEFNELGLSDELRTGALGGLREVQTLFERKNPPP